MRRVVAPLAAALMGVGTAVVAAPSAQADPPATVYVNPAAGGSDRDGCAQAADACGTIGHALGIVAPGGTVIVEDGTYDESPVITQAVTLIGHDASFDALTIGDADGPVELSGFTITSATTPLVSVSDHAAGAQITLDGNAFTGTTDLQAAVTVTDNAADVAITGNAITGTTTGIDVDGNDQQAGYTVTGNTFDIASGAGAAIALSAQTADDVLAATVGGNSGTTSADGRTITRAGNGTITVTPTSTPNTLAATGTSIAVPDAPTTLTTLEDPSLFTATVASGSTLPSAALGVTVTAPAGTAADGLALGYNLDGGSDYTAVPLLGTGPFHATVADLSGLTAAQPDVVHLQLAALAGASAGALSIGLSLDETAQDGTVLNTAATASLPMTTIVNSVPTATDQPAVAVARNGSTDITLGATDADGDPITGWAHGEPANGMVNALADDQHLRYTPTAGYSGTDSFTFTATDKAGKSLPATITITVTADNAPTANDLTWATRVDYNSTGVSIPLTGLASDPDSDPLTFSGSAASEHGGSVSITPDGTATYTPPHNFGGPDTFSYQVNDGTQDSNAATVTLNVDSAPVITDAGNHAVAHNDTGQTNSIPVTLTVSDVDVQDSATWAIVGTPAAAHGTVTPDGSTFTYQPDVAFVGTDHFTVSADDSHGGVTTHQVSVDVTDTPPTLTVPSDPVRVDYNKAKTIPVTCSDIDTGDIAQLGTPTGATKGTTKVTNCVLTYTPRSNAIGVDSFTVHATDGHASSVVQQVDVVIDTPPTAVAPAVRHVAQGKSVTIVLSATDPDQQDTLGYSVKEPARGTVKRSGTRVTYTAPTRWAGNTSFPFTVTDGHGGSSTRKVEVVVDKAPVSMSLALSPSRPTSAQRAKLTVHVTSVGNPNGTVTVGAQTAQVRSGSATFTLPQYAGGTHTVSATFNGSSSTLKRTSRKIFTVTKVASSLAATTNPVAITAHTSHAVLTVTIHAGPFHPSSGSITIYDENNGQNLHLGDTTPSNGTARFTLPRLGIGQHDLHIGYAGTSSVAASAIVLTERVPARA